VFDIISRAKENGSSAWFAERDALFAIAWQGESPFMRGRRCAHVGAEFFASGRSVEMGKQNGPSAISPSRVPWLMKWASCKNSLRRGLEFCIMRVARNGCRV